MSLPSGVHPLVDKVDELPRAAGAQIPASVGHQSVTVFMSRPHSSVLKHRFAPAAGADHEEGHLRKIPKPLPAQDVSGGQDKDIKKRPTKRAAKIRIRPQDTIPGGWDPVHFPLRSHAVSARVGQAGGPRDLPAISWRSPRRGPARPPSPEAPR